MAPSPHPTSASPLRFPSFPLDGGLVLRDRLPSHPRPLTLGGMGLRSDLPEPRVPELATRAQVFGGPHSPGLWPQPLGSSSGGFSPGTSAPAASAYRRVPANTAVLPCVPKGLSHLGLKNSGLPRIRPPLRDLPANHPATLSFSPTPR